MSKVQPNFTSSNNDNNKHVLVVGATGLTGRPAVELFGKMGWNVTATSRRTLDYPVASTVTHIPCDLLNDELCQKTFQSEHFHSCTHIIYCALFENMNRTDNIDYLNNNDRMMRNVLGNIIKVAKNFQHIQFMQGGKAYGITSFGIKSELTPYKERDERVVHENFYFLQEDFIKELQKQTNGKWTYTIWRPPFVLGFAMGSPISVLTAIAIYAVVMKERGEPFRYSGSSSLVQEEFVDSRLLADAFYWASENTDKSGNEAFNITNGDHLIWQSQFPKIAEYFKMECSEPSPFYLQEEMEKQENIDAWERIVKKHNLRPLTMDQIVGRSFQCADFSWGMIRRRRKQRKDSIYEKDAKAEKSGGGSTTNASTWGGRVKIFAGMQMSTIKLRRAGFHGCVDTSDMCFRWFKELQDAKILPVY